MRTIRRIVPRHVEVTYECRHCGFRSKYKSEVTGCDNSTVELQIFSIGDTVKLNQRRTMVWKMKEREYRVKGVITNIRMIRHQDVLEQGVLCDDVYGHYYRYTIDYLNPISGERCSIQAWSWEMKYGKVK